MLQLARYFYRQILYLEADIAKKQKAKQTGKPPAAGGSWRMVFSVKRIINMFKKAKPTHNKVTNDDDDDNSDDSSDFDYSIGHTEQPGSLGTLATAVKACQPCYER